MMMAIDGTVPAVFLAGLLGGVHCAGMCGGIVGAMGMASAAGAAPARVVPIHAVETTPANGAPASAATAALSTRGARLLAFNGGRLAAYTASGAIAGAAGSLAWLLEHALPVQQGAYALSSLVLVATGLYLLGVGGVVRRMETLGTPLWRRLSPHAARALRGTTLRETTAAGALWGLVPCGMVYAVLIAALASGGARQGATLMLAFGLGTLPNLMALGLAGSAFRARLARRWPRRLTGLAIAGWGLLGLARLDAARSLPMVDALLAGTG